MIRPEGKRIFTQILAIILLRRIDEESSKILMIPTDTLGHIDLLLLPNQTYDYQNQLNNK